MPSRQWNFYQERIAMGLCRTCGREKIYKRGRCFKHYIEAKKQGAEYYKGIRIARKILLETEDRRIRTPLSQMVVQIINVMRRCETEGLSFDGIVGIAKGRLEKKEVNNSNPV